MELGSNAPIIVMPDADLNKVAEAIAATGYSNAGQVCISTQRVIAQRKIYEDVLAATKPKVEALTTGNPLDEKTKVGPMIREPEAVRVEQWVNEAVKSGARIVTGGARTGRDLHADDRRRCETGDADLVRGVVWAGRGVHAVRTTWTKRSRWPTTASSDWQPACSPRTSIRRCSSRESWRSGNIHINWGPQWRQDLMPYGGLKESGFGKEGPRYAVEEMTELKMVCFHLKS